MYARRIFRLVLVRGLLLALVGLAMSACAGGGGEEQAKAKEEAKARTLPPVEKALRPGEYRSVKFEPSLSFHVGKGWWSGEQELPDFMQLASQERTAFLRFANVKEVYKPGTQDVVETPQDLVGWLQDHPDLKTGEPKPITVGGVKGEQLDVLVRDLPEDVYGECGAECVDIAPLSGGEHKGWSLDTESSYDLVILRPDQGMAFVRVEEVYKPRTQDAVKVPEDLVGWFQDHPYLKTSKPEPITVGGIEGQQFDFVADVPEGRYSMCGADCVDAFENADGSSLVYDEGDKYHAVIVDVKGETVYIESAAPAANSDKAMAPEAQKVVDTIEWKSS